MSEQCTGPFSDARDCPIHNPKGRKSDMPVSIDRIKELIAKWPTAEWLWDKHTHNAKGARECANELESLLPALEAEIAARYITRDEHNNINAERTRHYEAEHDAEFIEDVIRVIRKPRILDAMIGITGQTSFADEIEGEIRALKGKP